MLDSTSNQQGLENHEVVFGSFEKPHIVKYWLGRYLGLLKSSWYISIPIVIVTLIVIVVLPIYALKVAFLGSTGPQITNPSVNKTSPSTLNQSGGSTGTTSGPSSSAPSKSGASGSSQSAGTGALTTPSVTPPVTAPVTSLSGIVLGLDTPPSNDSTAISQIGKTPNVINEFVGWTNSDGSSNEFPQSWVNSIISLGSTPMLTWQPNLSTYKTTSVLTSIANGSQDSYITAWANAAKAENHPIYVRLMHEFNGDWYPWGEVKSGVTPLSNNQLGSSSSGTYPYTNTSQMFVSAYQRVVFLFQQVGATNVQFIWCFATGGPISNISSYYPGNNYVSWASMDGYNRSSSNPVPFSQLFTTGYNSIVGFSSRPIMIAETASVEFSGLAGDPSSKAQWITDAFLNIIPNNFPRIKAINYFDSAGNGYSYQIDTSSTTLNAIKQVYSNSIYQASAPSQTLSY